MLISGHRPKAALNSASYANDEIFYQGTNALGIVFRPRFQVAFTLFVEQYPIKYPGKFASVCIICSFMKGGITCAYKRLVVSFIICCCPSYMTVLAVHVQTQVIQYKAATNAT